MTKIRTLSILNAFTLLIHILVSYGAHFGYINDRTISEVSDLYPSVFTPAATTFGIWGVIYSALAVFCVYHIYTAFRRNYNDPSNRDIRDIGALFIVNNIISTAWLLVWTNNEIVNSLVLIVIQFITLLAINIRLKIHDENRKFASKACTQFPFSIYFAWITVAMLANLGVWMVSSGFAFNLNPAEWAVILITVTIMFAVLIILIRRNVVFGLVIIWALYGIILKTQQMNSIHFEGVMETAWMGAGVVSLICLYQLIRNFVYENQLNQDVPEYAEKEEVVSSPTAAETL